MPPRRRRSADRVRVLWGVVDFTHPGRTRTVPSGVKKILILLGVVFLLLLVAGGAITAVMVLQPGKLRQIIEGETRLLDYLGAQVVGIANAQLVPDLSFETIRYEAPYTLTLGGVALVAQDSTRVLDLGQMIVTLKETPRVGEPLKIARLTLSNGAINLIRDADSGGFRGLSPLVEPPEELEEEIADKPEFRLSNVLVLDKIVVSGINLVYDAGDGSAPMRLDALAADLDIVPATDAGEGWYELNLASGRKPGLEVDLDGRINIETFELALNRVTAIAQLSDATATTLPPQLAAIVNANQIRGAMRATATGRVPLMAPAEAELNLEASLDEGNAVFGEYRIPIDSLNVRADMASGVVDLRALELAALGGTMTADGRVVLGGDASLGWTIAGMELRELLASRPADQQPKMAGVVNGAGRVRAPVAAPMGGISGAGDIAVTEGRLVNIPVFSDLVEVVQLTGLTGSEGFSDSFRSPFTLSPQGLTLDGFEFRTPALAARGGGTMSFDGVLDFSVNGGPVEALQNRLGQLGSILGKITDRFVTYRVRGTVAEPSVAVQPLGIGG